MSRQILTEHVLHNQPTMLIPDREMHMIQYTPDNSSDRYEGQMQMLGFTLCSVCVWRERERLKGVWIEYNKSKYLRGKTKEKRGDLPVMSISLHCSSNFVRVSWHCSTWRKTILPSSSHGHLALLFWSYSTSHKGKGVCEAKV